MSQSLRAHRHGYIPHAGFSPAETGLRLSNREPQGRGSWDFMRRNSIRRLATARRGGKRYLLPLPILSVLLLGTALAAPGLLRMTVNVFDDDNLTILGSIQNVIQPDGPEGKIVGLMTVTNHGSTDIRITEATATIESLTEGEPDGRIVATLSLRLPLLVRAGETLRVAFSGPFEGSVLSLRFGDSFRVSPTVTWFGEPDSGPPEGPFTYAQAKTCTVEGVPLPNSVWTTETVCA